MGLKMATHPTVAHLAASVQDCVDRGGMGWAAEPRHSAQVSRAFLDFPTSSRCHILLSSRVVGFHLNFLTLLPSRQLNKVELRIGRYSFNVNVNSKERQWQLSIQPST